MQNSTKKSHHNQTKPLRNLQSLAIVGVAFLFAVTTLITPVQQTLAQNQSTTTTATTTEEISTTTSSEPLTSSERERLENRLAELQEQIEEQQQTVLQYKTRGQNLQSEINRLEAEIRSTNLQIESVELNLQKINQDIYETQRTINRTQNQIENHKEALSDSLQKVYETDKQSLIAILLKNDRVSDFFDSINNILLVQNNIQNSLDEVTNLRQELIQEKEQLSQEKENEQRLKRVRENQKRQIEGTQSQKEQLLAQTRNQEEKYQQILQETRKTAAEVRNQIFELVGGGELTFEKAYDLAKLAEDATGVRASLTMAILQRETNTGLDDTEQFLGNCSYNETVSQTGKPVMHPDRDIPIFETILANLEQAGTKPPNPVVSCPILSHGDHGGAMGPSQFIPSTWACYGGIVHSSTNSCRKNGSGNWSYKSSEDRIRQQIGGDDPSNPWNNSDAFTATALYIKDLINSSGCQSYGEENKHILPKQTLVERCAAAKYYAGGNWWTHRFWYGDKVLEVANSIQQDIDVIN